MTASKEARKAAFDKCRSKRIAAVVQEDFSEPLESKPAAPFGGGEHVANCQKVIMVINKLNVDFQTFTMAAHLHCRWQSRQN